MDFVQIATRVDRNGVTIVEPKFIVNRRSSDLMTRGKAFYCVWNEETNEWTTDETIVADLIDKQIQEVYKKETEKGNPALMLSMRDFSTRKWIEWQTYYKSLPDKYFKLNNKILFADQKMKRSDYATKTLPYSLSDGTISNYDHLISTLYSEEERRKIEWAIGSIFTGDSKKIQKFLVLYGDAGSGKSTVLNIIEDLFEGYWAPFNAKDICSSRNQFPLEVFQSNPLVGIQHDGDLSRIEDNTIFNSLVSHEMIPMNVKHKSIYHEKFDAFLFMGTNSPVKITDSKSGISRRLIVVHPSGNTLKTNDYNKAVKGVKTELGAIAKHCISVYNELGPHFYDSYRPIDMYEETNDFYNFMSEMYDIFKDGVTLNNAWKAYKDYCEEAKVPYPYSKRVFTTELKSYFQFYDKQKWLPSGVNATNYFSGLIDKKFGKIETVAEVKEIIDIPEWLKLKVQPSIFDKYYSDCKAQYSIEENGTIRPQYKWDKVRTTLSQLDTTKVHYVQLPNAQHICIDFDCKDSDGNKSLEISIKKAVELGLPETYAETSQSGNGLHLSYIYDGDSSRLANKIEDDIEIKVYVGNGALRRKTYLCNDCDIAHISGGLPFKEEKVNHVIDNFYIENDKKLRAMIIKNLNKGYHSSTKSSIDYIYYLLMKAKDEGITYDVTDLKHAVRYFAACSTHQSAYCLNLFQKMPFSSEENEMDAVMRERDSNDDRFIFFDVEVFPNVLIVCWKYENDDIIQRWIQPTPEQIEWLLTKRLIGFNNRKYDNHIVYARCMGYNNLQLFKLSKRLIANNADSYFSEAYEVSYADVLDFTTKKQSLKKYEIELGMLHVENAYPWDENLDESHWDEVAEYCANDVLATEATFKARHADWKARCILSDLSGLTPNASTRMHTTKIIFGNEKHPKLVYTDLSTIFPGYVKMEDGKSNYMGEDPGDGGYVYAEPGVYFNVALLDIASMHPSSIELLNLFGEYTQRFSEIKQARIFIKHKDYESAKKILDGKLAPYLTDEKEAKELSQALKIVINSVYGYTAASFDNPFRDPRNVDNIVAKRGALFMINLKHEVQNRGYTVAHIKTDSIKIPNADKDIIDFVMEYGKKYGYIFEHEDTYERMCLVNNAVYVAKGNDGAWHAVGKQFQVPYVFKTLFSGEQIEFADLCESKSSKDALYLDYNENLPDGEHDYVFVGKVGLFTPVKSGYDGGELYRYADNKYSYATGCKGYRFKESGNISDMTMVDMTYYDKFVEDAVDVIDKYAKEINITANDFIKGEKNNE